MNKAAKDGFFDFPRNARRNCFVSLLLGLLFVAAGAIFSGTDHGHKHTHAVPESQGVAAAHETESTLLTPPHESAPWWRRLLANLWLNNVFFVGISVVGVFFFALQYVAKAGWSVIIQRVPEAFGYWLPVGGGLMLLLFLVGGHDLFHWTHEILYQKTLADGTPNPHYDPIIAGKSAFLNTPFYLIRMAVFLVGWYLFFRALRRHSLREDAEGGLGHWGRMRTLSTIFVVFFAVTSSVAAWDWLLSIDTHWFSTMFGWYVFASWFAGGLALITYLVIYLKEKGYLPQVSADHLHDLGKYVFAFSIFWTYIWFSQYLLIYYANIPEEAVYFAERMHTGYASLFYVNLIANFFFPFLFLMTRDAKRYVIFLKIACVVVFLGHWLDVYLMVTPGVLGAEGHIGWMEIGTFLAFLGVFCYVLLRGLKRAPLVAKRHPLLAESLHHHV